MSRPPSDAAARPARAAALSMLIEAAARAVAGVRAGRSLTDALAALPVALRPGAQALAFHALRHLGTVQALRAGWVKRAPPAPADALLLVALALLLPELDPSDAAADTAWGEDAPAADAAPRYAAHTVVDQAVRAAKRLAPQQANLINAVLRRVLREGAARLPEVRRDDEARWNHPRWWIERLRRDWPEQWETLLQRANRRAPMTLRVNARWGDAAAYARLLTEAGLPAQVIGSHAIVLRQPQPVQRLPLFDAGAVSVQDAAAQLAAPLLLGAGDGAGLAPLPVGARVLDACAAPGGKTAHLLELADLDVLALDVDPARAARITDTLGRLHLQARVAACDAARPDTWDRAAWDGRPFDAILLDAPCSASGIVRRHPDVRWLRRESDLAALARTQDRLFDGLWPLLAPGGRLLYCTCSVFRDEGERRVDAFLQRTPDARPAPAPGHLPSLADNGRLQSLLGSVPEGASVPVADGFDGFFYALLIKRPA